ncbi:hypothetical protein ACROYT_G018834 [Oculina patagonica]
MEDTYLGGVYTGQQLYETDGVDNYWTWIEGTVLPSLSSSSRDWAKGCHPLENYTIDCNSRLVGGARIRQLRVSPGSCQVPGPLRDKISACNDFYSFFKEDKNNYITGWVMANTTSNTTSNTTATPSPWTYQTMEELGGIPFLGLMGTYGGGGYSFDLSVSNVTEAYLSSLKENSWIDSRTRAIFVEVAIYSAQVNLFGVATFLTEWIPTNGIVYFNNVKVARLYSHGNNFHVVMLVCEIFLAIFVAVFMYTEMKKAYKLRKEYYRDPWNWLEIAQIVLILTCAGALLQRTVFAQRAIKHMKSNPEKFTSFIQIITWDEIFGYSLAFLVFFANLKLLKLIRFNHRIYVFTKTLSTAASPLMSFMIVFSIFYFAYSVLFYAMFGSILPEYRSFLTTIETLFNTVMGAFDFEIIRQNDRILGPIIFFSFMMIMVMILLNVFLTILMDSFAEVQADENLKSKDAEVVEMMMKRFKYFFVRTDKVDILTETSAEPETGCSSPNDRKTLNSINQPSSDTTSFRSLSENWLEQARDNICEQNHPQKAVQASFSSIENADDSSQIQRRDCDEENSYAWSSFMSLANERVEVENCQTISPRDDESFMSLSNDRVEMESDETTSPYNDELGEKLAEKDTSDVWSKSSNDSRAFSRKSSTASQGEQNKSCESVGEECPPSTSNSPQDSPRFKTAEPRTLLKSRRSSSSGYSSSFLGTVKSNAETELSQESEVSHYYDLLDRALDTLDVEKQESSLANSSSMEPEVSHYYKLLEKATKELDQDAQEGTNALETFDFTDYRICDNNFGNSLVKDSELEENVEPKLGELTGNFAIVAMSDIQEDQIYEQLLKTYVTLLNEVSFEPDRDTMESQLMKRFDKKAKWKYTRHMYTEP